MLQQNFIRVLVRVLYVRIWIRVCRNKVRELLIYLQSPQKQLPENIDRAFYDN